MRLLLVKLVAKVIQKHVNQRNFQIYILNEKRFAYQLPKSQTGLSFRSKISAKHNENPYYYPSYTV